MDEIIAAAAALGKQIAAHPRARAFIDAARAVSGDAESQRILHDVRAHHERYGSLDESGGPADANAKQRWAELEAKVAGNEKIKAMLRCQADYMELMTRVHEAIDAALET